MPTYERELDLVQGYNFKKDVQKPFGFITALSIGGLPLIPDQVVTDPLAPITAASVTGANELVGGKSVNSVLKRIKWDLGDTDPIEFDGTLSVTGKQTVMGLLYATMISTEVRVSWVVYEYDPLAKVYFIAFSDSITSGAGGTTAVASTATSAATGVPALIKKDGDNLALTISPSPSTEVQSPENYDFTLQIVPWPQSQALLLSSANLRKVTKPWGRIGPSGLGSTLGAGTGGPGAPRAPGAPGTPRV